MDRSTPVRVEREPASELSQAVHWSFPTVSLKKPFSHRSHASVASKKYPAAHAQVPPSGEKNFAHEQGEESPLEDLPIGQTVYLSALVELHLPDSQSSPLVLKALEYVPDSQVVEAGVEVEYRYQWEPGSQLTQAKCVLAPSVAEDLPDSQCVQTAAAGPAPAACQAERAFSPTRTIWIRVTELRPKCCRKQVRQ